MDWMDRPLQLPSHLRITATAAAFAALALVGSLAFAPPARAAIGIPSADGVWTEIDEGSITPAQSPQPLYRPNAYRVFRVAETPLTATLSSAPAEFTSAALTANIVMTFPMPDGSYQTFRITESNVLSREMAAQHPELESYYGQGIENPAAAVYFDRTPAGFHAMILSSEGRVFIDPYTPGDREHCLSYWATDAPLLEGFSCGVPGSDELGLAPFLAPSGDKIRAYRLVIAATGEYTQGFGGVAGALNQIMTTVTRVDGIYRKEACIRLNLVRTIIFPDPATDRYPGPIVINSGLLDLNNTVVNDSAGAANYDIGHLVHRGGGGGLAGVGVVCGGSKARAATASGNPQGDPYDVDYVAHEIGHQFGGNHTFNGTSDNCGGTNRNGPTAYEPGSGSTIMAYAGICVPENVQPNSDPYFHTVSFDQITAYREGGGNCGAQTNTGNAAPNVSAGGDFTIPRNTPFRLNGSGNDPNSDPLEFCWEQFDLGTMSPPANNADGPIFRSRAPTASTSRTFPPLTNILNNTIDPWDKLPTVDRTLNFRFTARDNRAGGGGVNYDAMVVTVSGAPFTVNAPNGGETLPAGCSTTVAWTVGGGSVAPNVNILYSSDGGLTFPTTLASNTPNDGSQAVTLPCAASSDARIKIEGAGNIFFDISNGNFTVQRVAPTVAVNASGGAVDATCQKTVTFGGTITDDCCVNASDVSVAVTLTTGNATLGTPTVNKVQTDSRTVTVSGSVVVSALTSCPATVRVRIDANDCCGASNFNSTTTDVNDLTLPVISCPGNITVECTSYGGTPADDAQLTGFFSGISATDNCDPSPTMGNDGPAFFNVGATPVTFTATDACNNSASCTDTVFVVDTTPPVITVELDRTTLWPPNHKLSTINAAVTVIDICDPNPTFVLKSITSDEPENGLGDGDQAPDVVNATYNAPDVIFELRSERSGLGDGRTYTIIYTGIDEAGNTADDTVTVNVPHDRPGTANLASGFREDGSDLRLDVNTFAITLLSTPEFDATSLKYQDVFVGNHVGIVAPLDGRHVDADHDGRADMVVTYSAAPARTLRARSSAVFEEDEAADLVVAGEGDAQGYFLGLHYRADEATYWVPNLFALGAPIAYEATGVEPPGPVSAAPTIAALTPSPNPFATETRLAFAVSGSSSAPVELSIFNTAGQRVRTLVNEVRGSGRYEAIWDGRDDSGSALPSGVYFYKLAIGSEAHVNRIILAR